MRSGAIKIAVGLVALTPAVAAEAALAAAPSGVYEVRTIATARAGVAHPTRIAASPGGRVLHVGNRRVERRLTLDEQPIGGLRRAGAAPAPAAVSRLRRTLRGRGHGSLRMLARHPGSRLVYLLSGDTLLAFDHAGHRRHALSVRGLDLVRPRAIAFARSGDGTDAPSRRSLYVADPGAGGVVEVAFERAVARYAAVERVVAPFVRSVATSAFSPSSPDPAGIAYVAAQDRFVISDSEVEEMSLYQGANLFTNARGSLLGNGTGTTVRFSKEPAGLGYDPATRTLYVSDDDGDRVVVDRPGPDGVHGTRDDVTTRLLTSSFGSGDPEGVEYDAGNGHLYVCDGGDLEIYDWSPGTDATFGNGDDIVTSFDIASPPGELPMRDCEGLGQDTGRGTLLAVDPTRNLVYEWTKAGSLTRVIDVTGIPSNNKNLASVTVAPSSDPADSPSQMSYWLADRQRDNGPYPSENDGLVHEALVPGAVAPPDAAPSAAITAPVAGAAVSGTVVVRADATDDLGVTQVRFLADGAAIAMDADGSDGWSATWDTATAGNGSHTLVAVATDTSGNQGASAPVDVTVSNPVQNLLSVPVRAGADDASELENGTVNRGSGDLELGSDQGIPTTTGVRFTGLQIPRGAQILNAAVQFNADELDRAAATLTVRAQAADHAGGFTTTAFDVSSRPVTAAFTAWSVPTWTVFGAQGPAQRTPNIASVVQEVVDRPGWASGNAIAIVITGSGRRTAESFEGGIPPVLDVEFAAP